MIEFDYCCCLAAFALKSLGYETIRLNCNLKPLSTTDYDTSDRLYFEPLTFEHVMNVIEREQPAGVIVQFGGQTPLNLAESLETAGVPILGTSPKAIRLAEDREQFSAFLAQMDIPQPEHRIVTSLADATRPPLKSAIRCWYGPPTSWADGPWPSSAARTTWMYTSAKPSMQRPAGRCWWTASWKTP